MEQQKFIDDAIKAGPYFKEGPRQLKEATQIPDSELVIEATATQVTETQAARY